MAKEVKKATKKIGRPSKFTIELFEEICQQISEGKHLRGILRSDPVKYPSFVVFYDWVKADDALMRSENPEDKSRALGLSLRLARAREDGHAAIEEELLEIADNGTNDWMVTNANDNVAYRLNGEHVQRSKLRIETRLKLLAVWNPKKYGNKVEVAGTGKDGEHLIKNTTAAPQMTKDEWLKAFGVNVSE